MAGLCRDACVGDRSDSDSRKTSYALCSMTATPAVPIMMAAAVSKSRPLLLPLRKSPPLPPSPPSASCLLLTQRPSIRKEQSDLVELQPRAGRDGHIPRKGPALTGNTAAPMSTPSLRVESRESVAGVRFSTVSSAAFAPLTAILPGMIIC